MRAFSPPFILALCMVLVAPKAVAFLGVELGAEYVGFLYRRNEFDAMLAGS